jgi:hypothetical protein
VGAAETRGGPGALPRRGRARPGPRSELLRAVLFLASVVVVTAVFAFTSLMVRRLSEQVAATSDLLARLCAQASFPATLDLQLQRIMSGLIAGIDFPIIITDTGSIPRAWRHVGLDPALVPDASLDSLAMGRPISPVIQERVDRLRARARLLDRRHEPIVMSQASTGVRLGLFHYGDPPLLERLRWMPFLTAGGIGLLLGLGLWGLAGIRRAERRSIWVGMALETAHQLGTPLSSLMGWIELLRSRLGDDGAAAAEVAIPRAELVETLEEMERDVERLAKVAQRFSRVGSAARLEPENVAAVVGAVVQYMRRRLPRNAGEVTIEERYDPVPPLPCNRELLEWAVENLLANALSAMDKSPGRIEVWVEPRAEGRGVEIGVRDNGRGMTLGEQRRAFEPGYTTKPRGWGLGLALSRRVVEEYHRGRIFIRHSAPQQGTTVVIRLPA